MLELYSDEILDDPREALNQRYEHLLEKVPATLLIELLARRWRAAIELGNTATPDKDLAKFEPILLKQDEVACFRLLVSLAAMCFAVDLKNPRSTFENCQERAKAFGHLSRDQGYLFDRLDHLEYVAREAGQVMPRMVRDVVFHFIAGRLQEASCSADSFLTLAASKPDHALQLLDQVFRSVPLFFSEFGKLLDWVLYDRGVEISGHHSDETVHRLVQRLLRSILSLRKCSVARVQILTLCCAEGLHPFEISQVLAEPAFNPNRLGQWIAGDEALRLAYQSYCLGWARCQEGGVG